MSAVDLSRLQFATTSIYHFLFVPLTIGLAFLTAILQTLWYRKGNPEHLRLTRFFGTLLVINVAVGVVTGLVQEFQFGMNWSTYSRFVGDVFGAPLAMEGLAAFFLESVFLGLWLFGWDRLSKRVHLATIWAVAVGGVLSAAFIMAANSWMQRPVGYQLNAAGDRAQLTDIWALLTNIVFLWAYLHVVAASLVTGSAVMLAVSAWHLRRDSNPGMFQRSAKLAIVVLIPATMLALFFGGRLGINETKYQPMKIAAAEGQWTTCQPCSFSVFQIGGGNNDPTPKKIIEVPHLLSVLATGTWNGQVVGLNELQSQDEQQYGAGNYIPNIFIQYWSMRAMAYGGVLVLLVALCGAWLHLAQEAGDGQVVPADRHLGGRAAVPDEHRRLGADRERPPALDRAGPAAGQGRRLAVEQRHNDRHQPQRVRPALRGPGRRRLPVDATLRPQGAGPRRPPRPRKRHPPSPSPTEAST